MKRSLASSICLVLLILVALPLGLAATPPPAELLTSGRVDEAIDVLRSRLQAQPNDAEAHSLLGRAYALLQHWDDAIAAGQRATELAPENALYHLWLGRAYGEKADHSSWTSALPLARKTRQEFERAVALNPRNIDARTDLAEFYISAPGFLGGGKDKAQAQARDVVKLGDEPTAHWIQAKIAESDKNWAVAEQQYKWAVEKSASNPNYLMNLAAFYQKRGRLDEMEKNIQQAVHAGSNTKPIQTLVDGADLLFKSGRNFSGAIELLRQYIAAPHHSEDAPLFSAHYLMGTILERMGNRNAAAEQYRAALTLASNFEPAQTALRRLQ